MADNIKNEETMEDVNISGEKADDIEKTGDVEKVSAEDVEVVDSQEAAEDNEEALAEGAEEEGTEEEGADTEKNGAGKSDKKSFFKKEKKDKKDALIEELTDKYKRTFAEFDNFRKRSEKEKAAMYEVGAKSVIEKILPVVDNFERGFKSVSEEDMSNPFVDGMDKIYKQLMKTLEDLEVKPIETVGVEFDPNFHNAVLHIDDDSYGESEIVEELQKGYMYRGSVVRHSMVKVAN